MTALFFFCVVLFQALVLPVAMRIECGQYYTVPGSPVEYSLAPAPAPAPGQAGASYGTCASVFPNASATMPAVGNAVAALQNMAQVSCSAQGLVFWVATVGNNCAAPACFTSAGVACAPGSAGCPCTVVAACTPRVASAPLDCPTCPPQPCVVCPPAPPPPPPPAVGRRLLSRKNHCNGGCYNPQERQRRRNRGPVLTCTTPTCTACQVSFAPYFAAAGGVCLAFLAYAGYLRRRYHSEYNIQKGACGDDAFVPWLFCCLCALAQEERAVDIFDQDGRLARHLNIDADAEADAAAKDGPS
jgi:Cys-rich protein (TIGR01571 family)